MFYYNDIIYIYMKIIICILIVLLTNIFII